VSFDVIRTIRVCVDVNWREKDFTRAVDVSNER